MSKPHEDDECYLPVDDAELKKLFYELHGRKFNVLNPTYLLPVDDDEIQRCSLLHRLIKFIFDGKIFVGPLKETLQFGEYRQVLDLGTGKGFWAVELCDLLPWVYVTGVDVAPIQFQEVPSRCRFDVWDINTYDMPYEDGVFDLIHARDVNTGIRDYPRFLRQVARWFTLWETYRSCLVLLGVDITVPQRFKQLLEETGLFENIEVFEGVIPVGFYPEDAGMLTVGQLQWMAHDLLLPALKPMFIHLGLLESRVDRIIKDAQYDLYHTDFKLSGHLHVAHAKRKEN
ncbi:S-adenosyl-L-methionine-dependent methyltransferase [Mycena capillaripes]|nr:S-adenosyl-L-methionine-dependent methyltransferase [Mycena capillaripes]